MVVQAALMDFSTEHTSDNSSVDILLCTGQLFKEYYTIFPHLFGCVLNQLNCNLQISA